VLLRLGVLGLNGIDAGQVLWAVAKDGSRRPPFELFLPDRKTLEEIAESQVIMALGESGLISTAAEAPQRPSVVTLVQKEIPCSGEC